MISVKRQRGMSLMEALVVLALIAAIVAIAIPAFFRILQAYRVQTAAQQLGMNLRFARNAAVKQKANYRVTIRDETDGTNPNTYLFEFDEDRDGTYQIYTKLDVAVPAGILIKSGGVTQVVFDSRGRSTPSGYIQMEGKNSVLYEIRITLNGSVQTTKI